MSPGAWCPERLSCHRPDRGRSGDRSNLGGIDEAELAIEGAGVGERRLEVAEAPFAIRPLKHGTEELTPEPLPLPAGLDSDEREIPMRIARVIRCEGRETRPTRGAPANLPARSEA
jgi:hypothetical protein